MSRRAAGPRLRVLFYGAAVCALLPLVFSQLMLRLPRQPASPVHPPFEEAFVASEGLRLRTWTVAAGPTGPRSCSCTASATRWRATPSTRAC